MKMLTTCMKISNEEIILWCYAVTEKKKVKSTDNLKTTQKCPHQMTERSKHPSEICVWRKFKRLKRSLINLRNMAMLLMLSGTLPGRTCFIWGIIHLMMNLQIFLASRCQEARQLSKLLQVKILRRIKWCHLGNASTIVASIFNKLISGFNYSRKA